MSRERLLANLRSLHGVASDTKLMNSLQDHGLVADEAVTIEDVPNADLVRAWNAGQETTVFAELGGGR